MWPAKPKELPTPVLGVSLHGQDVWQSQLPSSRSDSNDRHFGFQDFERSFQVRLSRSKRNVLHHHFNAFNDILILKLLPENQIVVYIKIVYNFKLYKDVHLVQTSFLCKQIF